MLFEAQPTERRSRRSTYVLVFGVAVVGFAMFALATVLGAVAAVYFVKPEVTAPMAMTRAMAMPSHQEHEKHHAENKARIDELEQMLEQITQAVKDTSTDVKKLLTLPADLAHQHEHLHAEEEATTTPSKWSAPYLLPRYYQRDRGTCWAFATIGLLEQSYRQHGVERGFLQANEYVRFSEQAYGISMINACAEHPSVCDVPGDFVLDNSTEGGEIDWIYSLTSLYSQVLPLSVCPYTPDGDDLVCPGMDAALATNPIKFNLVNLESGYSVEDSKALLLKYQKPLGWSSLMHNVYYYFPCTAGYWASQASCNITNRVRCPTDKYYNSEYCAVIAGAMYTMDGEFYMHENIVPEGGHAMNIVGFNDHYTTKAGFKGGFIIKNSWEDRVYGTSPAGRGARGSHSVAYWMQEISTWEEMTICPNPYNPENWLSCVQQSPGPTGDAATNGKAPVFDISGTCLDESFMSHLVEVSYQPTEFTCVNADFCSTDSRYRWFLAESVFNAEGDLSSTCMLRYDTTTGSQATICSPFQNPSAVAYIWQPIASQANVLQDSEDLCGYYFWPYAVIDKLAAMFGDFHSTHLELEWYDQSYYANSDMYPKLDYTLVKSSTGTQESVSFATALPNGNIRY